MDKNLAKLIEADNLSRRLLTVLPEIDVGILSFEDISTFSTHIVKLLDVVEELYKQK